MYHELTNIWKDLLEVGLAEDGWPWDWTTLGTQRAANEKVKARIVGKTDGIWAAQGLVLAANEIGNKSVQSFQVSSQITDGSRFHKGDLLVELVGHPRQLLALERPFLN